MSKGKDKCVAQGGQPERSGVPSQFTEFFDIIKKIEIPPRGRIRCTNVAFKKSKLPQASLRPFRFLTANPGKP